MYSTNHLANLFLVGFSATMGVIYLALIVLYLVALWRLFSKAGIEGWKCLIPFYNMYCLYKIAFGIGWLFFLTFIPFVNFIMAIILCFKLSSAFGHGAGYGFGLLFLDPIFILILAFDSSVYVGSGNQNNYEEYAS